MVGRGLGLELIAAGSCFFFGEVIADGISIEIRPAIGKSFQFGEGVTRREGGGRVGAGSASDDGESDAVEV